MYDLSLCPSSRTAHCGRYVSGLLSNLPTRVLPDVYDNSGLSVEEVRESYPHFTEISGGFAEIVLNLDESGDRI